MTEESTQSAFYVVRSNLFCLTHTHTHTLMLFLKNDAGVCCCSCFAVVVVFTLSSITPALSLCSLGEKKHRLSHVVLCCVDMACSFSRPSLGDPVPPRLLRLLPCAPVSTVGQQSSPLCVARKCCSSSLWRATGPPTAGDSAWAATPGCTHLTRFTRLPSTGPTEGTRASRAQRTDTKPAEILATYCSK